MELLIIQQNSSKFASTHLSLHLVLPVFTLVRKSRSLYILSLCPVAQLHSWVQHSKVNLQNLLVGGCPERGDMLLFLHGEGIAHGEHGVIGLGILGLAPHIREDLVQHVGTTGWRRRTGLLGSGLLCQAVRICLWGVGISLNFSEVFNSINFIIQNLQNPLL